MINSGSNEDNIPIGEAFSSCAYILGTCSMIYKYNFKKIMTMKKGGGIAVMPADVDIPLFAFFKIFFIIHFIRNNFRKEIWNYEVSAYCVFLVHT